MCRPRILKLLQGYGVGPRALTLLKTYWDQQKVTLKQGGCYGRVFHPERGVTQGDIASPTLFNIMIDAVCRQLFSHLKTQFPEDEMSVVAFYADDGYIGSLNPVIVQDLTTISADLFERMGLQLNTTKTVSMTNIPVGRDINLTDEGYNHRYLGKEHESKKKTSKLHQGHSITTPLDCKRNPE